MSALNLPKITIGQVKDKLIHYYKRGIESGEDLKRLRAVFLWSLPGIGKSQMAIQVVEALRELLYINVEFREIRLSDCTIFELLGLMHQNPQTNGVEYVEPPIYQLEDPETYVVYLFDELDKASPQLQAAALHLILDRKFWVYELPKNSIVMAAGNPENIEGELFSKFRPELNNRFRHYLIEADYPCWEAWAQEAGVNSFVIDFLSSHSQYLYSEDGGEETTAFSTPRSWAAVSDYLNLMGDADIDWDEMYHDICGDIGMGAALAFKEYYVTAGCLPVTEDIFLGRTERVPKRPDEKNMVINSMLAYLWTHRGEMTERMWDNACNYVNQYPPEYGAVFYRNVQVLDMDKSQLINTEGFRFWQRKHGKNYSL